MSVDAFKLRAIEPDDLAIFFEYQLDPLANQMAAFTSENPADRAAYDAKWKKILADDGVTIRTVVIDGVTAGSVLVHGWFGDPEVSYWYGREFWGKGIATRALTAFLREIETRPLYARVATDNAGSIRVLEKCGFWLCGKDRGFANGRGEEVDEFIFRVDGAAPDS